MPLLSSSDDASPRLGERLRRWRRELSAGAHVLPGFLIIGAGKCGTSSLYAYLGTHPQVLNATRKEVRYFSSEYARGEAWYRLHFPTRAAMATRARKLGKRVVTGEASPGYLLDPLAPERIARDLPNARLIVLLRDPVARAYSHYHHVVKRGYEKLSWEEALRQELESVRVRGADMYTTHRTDEAGGSRHLNYLARGNYHVHLAKYLALFPREYLLVLQSEDMFADVQQAFDGVAAFLGLDSYRLQNLKPQRVGRYDRVIPQEAELRAFFDPHNRALYELLGRDFGW